VRYTRDPLDAADRFLVAGEVGAHGMQQRRQAADREQGEHDVVGEVGQHRPKAGQRHQKEEADEAQDYPDARPQALEKQRPTTRAHLAREFRVERSGGGLRLRHGGTIAGTLRRA
jgi:hypothetical protein